MDQLFQRTSASDLTLNKTKVMSVSVQSKGSKTQSPSTKHNCYYVLLKELKNKNPTNPAIMEYIKSLPSRDLITMIYPWLEKQKKIKEEVSKDEEKKDRETIRNVTDGITTASTSFLQILRKDEETNKFFEYLRVALQLLEFLVVKLSKIDLATSIEKLTENVNNRIEKHYKAFAEPNSTASPATTLSASSSSSLAPSRATTPTTDTSTEKSNPKPPMFFSIPLTQQEFEVEVSNVDDGHEVVKEFIVT